MTGEMEKSIRCPSCKYSFKVKMKASGSTHIKCPNCGNEGILQAKQNTTAHISNKSQHREQNNIKNQTNKPIKRNIILPILVAIFLILSLISTTMYFSLKSAYISLQNEHYSLESDYNLLESTYDSLQSGHIKLQSEYNTLELQYSSLQTQHSKLQSDYENLENEQSELQANYQNYQNMVGLRYGYGEDSMKFITPDDFDIKLKTREILGHTSDGDLSWDDSDQINDWVANNIEYNYDTYVGKPGNLTEGGECWLFPNETLAFMHGDCEDKALLMISMCLSEAEVEFIWAAELSIENTDGTTSGHMCIFINVEDDRLYIYDPTVDGGGWSSGYSMPESDAIYDYINSLVGIESVEVYAIFNQTERHEFESNQEFFDWF